MGTWEQLLATQAACEELAHPEQPLLTKAVLALTVLPTPAHPHPQNGRNTDPLRVRQHRQQEMAHKAEVGRGGCARAVVRRGVLTRGTVERCKRNLMPFDTAHSAHPSTHAPARPPPTPQDCWDFEVECSYGWVECAGLADRSAYDLTVRGRGPELAAYRRANTAPLGCWGLHLLLCSKACGLPGLLRVLVVLIGLPCPPTALQAHAGMSKVDLNAFERFPEPREEDVLTIRACADSLAGLWSWELCFVVC